MLEPKGMSKRQLIIRAAVEVFGSKGYHNAKIEDIAQWAGVGKGTVYEYFQSKEQLFRDTLKEGINAVNQVINEQIDQEPTPRGKLIALTKKSIEIGQRYSVFAKLMMMDTSFMNAEFHEWLVDSYKIRLATIEKIVSKGIELGQIRSIDTSAFAQIFNGGISVICGPFASADLVSQDVGRLAEEIVDYFLQGIARHDG